MPTQVWKTDVIRVRTPDGTLYATFMKDNEGQLEQVQFSIGKAGAPLAAWANAIATVINLSIKKGATVEDLIVELSSITSDGKARTLDTTARSGPEGIWQAFIQFRQGWPEDRHNKTRDEVIYTGRGASVAAFAKVRDD